MWSAIKSDLFDFVSTIQQDTATTLNKVLGEENEEEEQDEQETVLEKLRISVRRTYETYANPLKENKAKEFEKFKKRFHLTAYSKEISIALDEEPEVSRFYAELVPTHIAPEEFWSRLFFRLHLLNRNGTASFEDDDDDEEELVWEEDVAVAVEDKSTTMQTNTVEKGTTNAETLALNARIKELEEENLKLKSQVKSLVTRVAQLELEVKTKVVTTSNRDADASSTSTTNLPQVIVPVTIKSQSPARTSAPVEVKREFPSLHNKIETASNSSEGSGVLIPNSFPSVLSLGSTTSLQEKDESGSEIAPAAIRPSDKYLASLDDDEDEEDGWN